MSLEENICYIFGSCEPAISNAPEKSNGSLFIAADNGFNRMKAIHLSPDVIIGDFDSAPLTDEMKVSEAQIIRHPTEKDDTDLMLAIKLGFSRGFKDFRIYGCIGGERFDHSVATLQSLSYVAQNGGRATAYGKGGNKRYALTVIKNSSLKLKKTDSGYVSVFSLCEKSEGVSISGLKYSLSDATLTSAFPLGASNGFCGSEAEISVENGVLLVIYDLI